MKKLIKVGEKFYKTKKEIIEHYKKILNSYKFNEFLNDEDYNDLMDLIEYDFEQNEEDVNDDEEIENKEIIQTNLILFQDETENQLFVENIRIKKVQFNTKCFELIYSDKTSVIISYLMIINNRKYNSESLFNAACRNAINEDLRLVKQKYFDDNSVKGFVKCQETNILSKWKELVIDHRQPNTFSVIVDRFKEIKQIDLEKIEYKTLENNFIVFKNKELELEFKNYHKYKANLRIVRKECNLSRTNLAKIKKNSKDLSVN